MSLAKRLDAATMNLEASVEKALAKSPALPALGKPKTAIGHALDDRKYLIEIAELKKKLEHFDGSFPTRRLPPRQIANSAFANRIEESFATPAFARLKDSIRQAGGNTQPILVRHAGPGAGHGLPYEVVFGHRRRRACEEVGVDVLAVVWDGEMPDEHLFLSMDRENRERADPSPYEQGLAYLAALDKETGLYPSARALADAVGVSHTWVNKALQIARLPPAIVAAFASPLEIKPRHAQDLAQALETDATAVLKRAEKLRRMEPRPGAGKVVELLLGRSAVTGSPQAGQFKVRQRTVGEWKRDAQGRAVITLDRAALDDEQWARLTALVQETLTDMA